MLLPMGVQGRAGTNSPACACQGKSNQQRQLCTLIKTLILPKTDGWAQAFPRAQSFSLSGLHAASLNKSLSFSRKKHSLSLGRHTFSCYSGEEQGRGEGERGREGERQGRGREQSPPQSQGTYVH